MTIAGRYARGALMLLGLGLASLYLIRSGLYGLTIFVIAPIAVGAVASWVVRPPDISKAAGIGALAVGAALLFFLLAGAEGLVCLLMAAPLAVPLGALGGVLAFRARQTISSGPGIAMMLLLPSATLVWDVKVPPPVFEVHSSIEIAAPPERVWNYVINFSELPPPDQWYFRAGLAYPIRAHIEGSGPGAVRYCEFSTGPFVEPIEVWDQPRLLRFRVTHNPDPMHEWSPYANVFPKHLHGYLVSKQGQFELTRLPGNRTRIEGTTWYQHGLWPAEYWRWWSDAIIHRIHMRVLNQIKVLAES